MRGGGKRGEENLNEFDSWSNIIWEMGRDFFFFLSWKILYTPAHDDNHVRGFDNFNNI